MPSTSTSPPRGRAATVEGLARNDDEAQGLASPEAASAPSASAAGLAASPGSSSH